MHAIRERNIVALVKQSCMDHCAGQYIHLPILNAFYKMLDHVPMNCTIGLIVKLCCHSTTGHHLPVTLRKQYAKIVPIFVCGRRPKT